MRAGSQGGTQAHLFLPNGSAREHEVGNVGTGDEQHESDRARKQQEPRLDIAHYGFQQRFDGHLGGPVVRHAPRELGEHLAMEGAQFCLALAGADPVTQASDGLVVHGSPRIVRVAGIKGDGNPELGFEIRKTDLLRSHPDDLAVHAVKHHGAADDVGVAAELISPEAVAQNDDVVLAHAFFLRGKETAQGGTDTECVKQVCVDRATEGAAGGSNASYVVFDIQRVAGNSREGMGATLVFANPALGKVVKFGASRELHQPVLVRERKRLEQDGIDDAEDGGVGAYA